MPRQSTDVLTLADWTVSRSELQKAIKRASQDHETKKVVNLGKALARNPTPTGSFEFSEAVCDWALMGGKVWGNLNRYYEPDALGKQLCSWFQVAKKTYDVEEAIKPGIAIKGLHVSFASKHIRVLWPQRFAVLDSVLSRELGFALNIAGYKLFLRMLREFKEQYGFKENIGTLEMGIYWFIKGQKKRGAR